MNPSSIEPSRVLSTAEKLRWQVPDNSREKWVEHIYAESARIAARNMVREGESHRLSWEKKLDCLLTSRWTGVPAMILIFAMVLWITIEGANVPSGFLAALFMETWYPALKAFAGSINMPWWLSGLLIDGIYLATAWVISVMLPPMAIFFPLFTLLEDFGYLPRVAFNLDKVFKKSGAHGKQSLTMMMGIFTSGAASLGKVR